MATASAGGPRRPLAGLLVLDLASNIAGSQAARLLAEAGARVVKVEGPERNPLADLPTWVGDPPAQGIDWKYANRGKDLWRLDYRSEQGRHELERALASADVLVHGWTDTEAADSGVDRVRLTSISPRLVVVSVTPFGGYGSRSDHRANDIVSMATGGLMYSTPGFPDFVTDTEADPPLRPSSDLAELASGVLAAAGCIEGLLMRETTGRGQTVDVSVQEVVASLLCWDYALWNYGGVVVGRRESRAGLSPNAYMPCRDGWVVIVAFMEHHWRELISIMGRPDWADSELFATMVDRGANWDALQPLLQHWLNDQDRLELMREAQRRGLPTCAALEIPEAFDNEQTRDRQFYSDLDGGRVPGSVFIVDGDRVRHGPPMTERAETAFLDVAGGSPISGGSTPSDEPGLRQALAGVRIIDFGQIVAMPLAAQWLAFMGAEVIQIESRVNLPSRKFAPIIGEPPENTSGVYNHVNRNKRSFTLNLRLPQGVEIARRLIATADVVCENFSAGTMERLGLGFGDLRKLKPDLIMISLSAFGRSGPWRDYNALHSGVMLLSGLSAVTGYRGDHPRMCGSILPDGLAACCVTLAAAQALYHKRRTGEGQYIELTMSEVVQALLPQPIFEFTRFGLARPRMGNRSPTYAPHDVYRSKGDDRWLALSARSDEEWRALCQVMDHPDLAQDDRFCTNERRLENVDELDAIISAWTRSVIAEEAAAELQRNGVLAGPVLDARDILEDEHLRSRGFVVEVSHPQAGSHYMPGKPWRLPEAGEPPIRHAPLLGDGNEYVLRDLLHLSDEQIRGLSEQEVFF